MRSYHQIPIAEDIPRIAVTACFSLFEFTQLPFVLRNAQTSHVLWMKSPAALKVVLYTSVTSSSPARWKNISNIRGVSSNEFMINLSKCLFAVPSLTFLGHIISAEVLDPTQEKVSATTNFTRPNTQHQLRRFLSMLNFLGVSSPSV